ncbi:hypothetical protein ACIQNU_32025 [Streptomyces sp. NPDC091292]|uniref:hypothetical protein n=1 Tax=Streptomyces sp. NPDC091292 TaxID=3365991 RepID=UPI00381FA5E0
MVRWFRSGGQWRETPQKFGARWSTVSHRFRQWRDAGGCESLLKGLIMDAAKRREVDLPLVGIDSTTAAGPSRCRRDAPESGRARRFGEGCRRGGGGRVEGGSPEGEAGRAVVLIRRGRAAMCPAPAPAPGSRKAALLGRSPGGQTSGVRLAAGVRLERGTGGRQSAVRPGARESCGKPKPGPGTGNRENRESRAA